MTSYLKGILDRLVKRWWELDDIEANYETFCGIFDLVMWIGNNQQALRGQYLEAVDRIKQRGHSWRAAPVYVIHEEPAVTVDPMVLLARELAARRQGTNEIHAARSD